ncbi:DUF3908 family protein [Bacillus pacificus]|uniref:DUF3908 family protein n=1 Tax=Bacillus pacificus TaxID=2026187 RepID=UPI003EDFA16A
MKKINVNDYFTISDARDYAKKNDKSEEMNAILSMVGKFHDSKECLVFYPKNIFEKEKTYELLFFFENEVVIGKSVYGEDAEELVVITRKKYANIKEIRLSKLYSDFFRDANAIEITFNDGNKITLNSLEDSIHGKMNWFINKIERIYSIL